MFDILIIGSGPSSLFTLLYIIKTYPNLKLGIVTDKFQPFHCTYGVFLKQIQNSWIFQHLDFNSLFINIIPTTVICPFDNQNHIIDNDLNYGIIDNNYLFNYFKEIISTNKITIFESKANQIIQQNKYYTVFTNSINLDTKFVIEAIGNMDPIGLVRNTIDEYKQYFYGYKIKLENHNINKCTLIDWSKFSNKINSFGYILPIDKDTLLVEETILSTRDKINYNDLLENLEERIDTLFSNYTIIEKEINNIPLNKPIPENNSLSLGIGQAGNMINNLSGYTLGYNIYHIPELCNSIITNNYNLKTIYDNFWCNKRLIINKINYIGLILMEDMTQEEISEFHYYYFKYIASSYNFDIMFLNCDNDFKWTKFISSFINYRHFPPKFYWKISRAIIKSYYNY